MVRVLIHLLGGLYFVALCFPSVAVNLNVLKPSAAPSLVDSDDGEGLLVSGTSAEPTSSTSSTEQPTSPSKSISLNIEIVIRETHWFKLFSGDASDNSDSEIVLARTHPIDLSKTENPYDESLPAVTPDADQALSSSLLTDNVIRPGEIVLAIATELPTGDTKPGRARNLFGRQAFYCLGSGSTLCPGSSFCCPTTATCGDATCLTPAACQNAGYTLCPGSSFCCPTTASCGPSSRCYTISNCANSGYTFCPGGKFCCATTATCILDSQICATPDDPSSSSSSPLTPTVVQNVIATVAPTPGMSLGDKIALGVGIGVGVPTFLVTLAMCLQGAG